MSLVDSVIELAENEFGVDWNELYSTVAERLRLRLGVEVCDPRRFPTYWCVPVLVGSYVGAPTRAVLGDLEPFLGGCLARHFMFESQPPVALSCDEDVVALTLSAYDGSRIDADPLAAFDERFAVKCLPWTQLLAMGTMSIHDEASDRSQYHAAMEAILHVYSCLQIVDDWHDRAEDAFRGHWNMWEGEESGRTLTLIRPLLSNAQRTVDQLEQHLLRRALVAQLCDAGAELRDLLDLGGLRPRDGVGEVHDDTASVDPSEDPLQAAARYLENQLTAGTGLWCDFAAPGISAGSTECISAFVATQLAGVPAGSRQARAVAGRLVAGARVSGGWGYRQDVPEDCDSTAWVLLAAAATGAAVPSGLLRHAQNFILDHQRRDGGFVTYGPAAREFLTPADQAGWFDTEVSVTSSAVLALWSTGLGDAARIARACEFIAANTEGGLWISYWWEGFGYSTYLASRALSVAGEGRYARNLRTAADAVRRARGADGMWGVSADSSDAFTTSLAVRTLLIHPTNDDLTDIEHAARWLREVQLPTGSWRPGARMLAPGASDNGDVLLFDEGTVTTATAIAALHEIGEAVR